MKDSQVKRCNARMPARMRADRPQCGLHAGHAGLHSLMVPSSVPWSQSSDLFAGRNVRGPTLRVESKSGA